MYDRNEIHNHLWQQAGHKSHRLTANSTVLARELGISYWHFTRIVQDFLYEGRLVRRKLSGGGSRSRFFEVVDPDLWGNGDHDQSGVSP